MDSHTQTAFDARSAVRDRGFVGIRDLSQHTTEVVRAVVDAGMQVLVTKHGVVVAKIVPTTLRAEIGGGPHEATGLSDQLLHAEKTAANGDLRSVSDLPD
jgi:prevent-host-death family protein